MQEKSDAQLLREYAAQANEAAFRKIVTRHADLVYASALRQVRSPELARDIAQSVFTDLVRKAPSLGQTLAENASLVGWLYRSTRFAALTQLRDDRRRQARERQAMENLDTASETVTEWERVGPVLDEAMADLSDEDRDALLLRFFKNHDFRTIGLSLGVSDDAAQKRVSRALERLRAEFNRRGVTTTAVALSIAVSANAVSFAPAGLAATLSTAALAGTTLATTATATITKTIAMTTLQKTLITATIVAAVGTGIYEARQASILKRQVQTLQQQQAPLSEQTQQLQRERDEATNRLAALVDEIERVKGNATELLKLRGEVARLRAEARESLTARIALLKQKLEQISDKKIPELQFLTEIDWANAAWNADLNTEDGVREALSNLREGAVNTFLNEMMKAAFKKYLAAHDGILPTDLFQLKPYFNVPVTDAMLQRYELLQSGKPDNSAELVKLVAFADEEYDSNHGMSINGAWGSSFNRVGDAVKTAAQEFAKDNNGQMPTDPSQIKTYLKKPIDPVTIQKYLSQITADPPPPEVIAIAPALKAYTDAHNGQPPQNPSDLQPYLTTPEQRAALRKLEQMGRPASK